VAFAGNVFDGCTALGLDATASDLFTITMGSGWSSAADSLAAAEAATNTFQNAFAANNNAVMSSGLNYAIEEGSGMLGLVPYADLSAGELPELDWFDPVVYPGAFDPSADCTWLEGWSMMATRGFIDCVTSPVEEAKVSIFEVYPNPSNGSFIVQFGTLVENAYVRIVDLNGKVVYGQNISAASGATQEFTGINLTRGLYVISLTNGSELHTSRLVVE